MRSARSRSACSPRPAAVAQDVADQLVDAGVRSILNFAPAVLTVPEGVSLRKVDLAIELQILSFYQLRHGIAGRVVSVEPTAAEPMRSDGPGAARARPAIPVNLLVRGRRVVVVGRRSHRGPQDRAAPRRSAPR